MTRTAAREIAVMLCFRETFIIPEGGFAEFFESEYYETLAPEDELFAERPDEDAIEYIGRVVAGVSECREDLDAHIEKYSKYWKLGRISRIAAAIMRVCMYEVLHMQDIPDSAAINEAVEIAKGYEEPETVAFINGILGSFYRAEIESAGSLKEE